MHPLIRYETPELIEQQRALDAEQRTGQRLYRIDRAYRAYEWEHCIHAHGHHGSSPCRTCVSRYIEVGQSARDMHQIDVDLDTEAAIKDFVTQIGWWWRLPVGVAAAHVIMLIASQPDTFCRDVPIPALAPDDPVMSLYCCGGGPAHALFTPTFANGTKPCTCPHVKVPIEYLIKHGVRYA